MSRAQPERGLSGRAGKSLIADEWRIAGGAVKPFARLPRPLEELALVNERTRRVPVHDFRCILVLLNPNTVRVYPQKTTVSA